MFFVFGTLAVNWKVCPTVKDAGTDPKTTAMAAGVVVGVAINSPPPQHAITISRFKLIPRPDALRRRPRIIAPAPLKPDGRFDLNYRRQSILGGSHVRGRTILTKASWG